MDESIQVIERLNISQKDFELILSQLAVEHEDGRIEWTDDAYTGRFYDYKEMSDTGSLFRLNNSLLNILNPDLLRSFEEVFMLTYLFDGQYQKAYLDFFGWLYRRYQCGACNLF